MASFVRLGVSCKHAFGGKKVSIILILAVTRIQEQTSNIAHWDGSSVDKDPLIITRMCICRDPGPRLHIMLNDRIVITIPVFLTASLFGARDDIEWRCAV